MQIGFDVGATKIESVILKDNGEEIDRSRRDCPKNYHSILQTMGNYSTSAQLQVWLKSAKLGLDFPLSRSKESPQRRLKT